MSTQNCTMVGPECPSDVSDLGYPPNMAASIFFVVVFAISLVGQASLGFKYKSWSFSAAMVLGSCSEVAGYIGRILMHANPYNLNTFLVQIICLTIAPAFYTAGIYLCLERIVIVYGEGLSRFRPVWYTRFFIFCDIVSLSLQGAGGGMASSATDEKSSNTGNQLMLAGVIFQVISLSLFAIACLDVAFRVYKNPAGKNLEYSTLRSNFRFRGFLWALLVSFLTIFTRCVYRIAELGGGWNNKLMREENPFIILESCMIVVAVFSLIAFHPGFGFQGQYNIVKSTVATEKATKEVSMESLGA
ncbi:RTA1 like protein-domain-containing protein [Amylocarpus encephaloides]|uniref:RTA1 like protein-domain-containing protein n=1 Tax=Amylocarpus encephaloides TaxID=45428 RepID=A0A9P8C5Y6_9HELO|nr:RTA1 like protein-domain-containing protein [Amylocarpus encephaloides]